MIRAARREDLEGITAIYSQAVVEETGTFEIDPPDLGEMTARFSRITSGGCPYLVAEANDGILGYAYAGAYHVRPAYRFTLEDSVYIRRDARGRGLGSALVDALLAEAARLGFRQMIAVIGDSANRGSIGVHTKAGFTIAGMIRSVGWKHGRWLDCVLMQRQLGAGDAAPAT